MIVMKEGMCWRVVGLLILLLGSMTGTTVAQDLKCADAFSRADAVYLEGRFDETVRLLRQCLDRETLFVQEAIPVYRLLALAHLNQGENEAAQTAVADLLVLAPDYEADPIQDPPSYVLLVTNEREDIARQRAAERVAEVVEETPVDEAPQEEEQSVEDAARVFDPPPAEEREEAQPLPLPSDAQSPSTTFFARPKSWFIAGGGALVIFAALGLAVGGADTGGQ